MPAKTGYADATRLPSQVLSDLHSEVSRRVAGRVALEERWIEDLKQFHGIYDEDTQKKLNEAKRSQIFINHTRVKTNALAAKLSDMLFPTDDLNWGVTATPVPRLTKAAKEAEERALAAQQNAEQQQPAPQQPAPPPSPDAGAGEAAAPMGAAAAPMPAQGGAQALVEHAVSITEKLRLERVEAEKRASAMQDQIKDQLDEARWPAQARIGIMDACKLGIGVFKGPIVGAKRRRGWEVATGDRAGPAQYQMTWTPEDQPSVKRVDPWNFFPDMSVSNLEDGEGDFERHVMNRKALRALAREDGFNRDAIRRLIAGGKYTADISSMMRLRAISDEYAVVEKDTVCVWEYTGPVEARDLSALYGMVGDDEGLAETDAMDELDEVHAVIWFCGEEVLKVAPHPLDSGETIYSVFRIEPDEGTVFARGMPAILRDPQKAVNGAWRFVMDHGGAAAGPQVVVDKSQVTPEDGDWSPRPFKIWLRNGEMSLSNAKPFDQFQVNSALGEMLAIVDRLTKVLDEVSGNPAFAEGDQGAGVTKTAQGMALLTSAGNIVFRKIVKQFDDDVPATLIRRFVDWNMQFSDREEIKGDHTIIARGSSVLLVREMHAQNLIAMADRYGTHPVFGPMLRDGGLPLLRQIVKAHMLTADEILLTDDEFKKLLKDMAEQADEGADGGLEQAKLEIEKDRLAFGREELDAKIQMANMEADARRYVADQQRETTMATTAEKSNVAEAAQGFKQQIAVDDRASKERALAVEAATAAKTGKNSGGSI
ncbi:MAG: hypothetical protein ACJA1L_001296 [Paracoccaceae bacterium]|jgi:hypothetical protein